MKYPLFKLEDYYIKYEFSVRYQLSSSDAESWSQNELVEMADPEARGLWENLTLSYTETPGAPLLREEIGKLYEKDLSTLVFAGAGEGIYQTLSTLLSQEDHAIVITPCYQSLKVVPQSFAGSISEIPLGPNWSLDLGLIKSAIRKETKVIIINFPHNPTGALIDKSTLLELIEVARRHDCYLFSDEVYRMMEINEQDRLPNVADLYEKGISLGVMSKAYGLPGLRIGWIASQDHALITQITNQKTYGSLCNSAPSEVLALIALRAKKNILARNRHILLTNIKILNHFFGSHPSLFEWTPPKGGCTGFPRLKAHIPIDTFTETLAQKKDVLLMPGTIYDDKDNHFRIGFGRANMDKALARLQEYIDDKNLH